jgi:hypothetical protein
VAEAVQQQDGGTVADVDVADARVAEPQEARARLPFQEVGQEVLSSG